MDTPGHVSERDGQEEDENKWAAGRGEGGKRCQVKDTKAAEIMKEKSERMEEHALESVSKFGKA